MKKIIFVLVVISLLVGIGIKFVTAPASAMEEIENGFQTKDIEKISKNVDFDLLRANIKEQLLLKMANKADESNDKMAKMFTLMSQKIVDGVLNTYLTKSGLKSALSDSKKKKLFEGIEYQGEMIDSDTYVVILKKEAKKEIPVTFKRYGLFEWKVTEIVMPE